MFLFKVKASKFAPKIAGQDPNLIGTGFYVANVTVKKATTVNKPPIVHIDPVEMNITLPHDAVILDGSSTTDDNTKLADLEYKWELLGSPLGYKLVRDNEQTLKLENLEHGKYEILLKVKDEGGLEGNATSHILVTRGKDYPPSANAGGDEILYLPVKEIILNGNKSTDDHGIISWEWTKGPDDGGLAVDMQNTRTPYLKLSSLEEGHYQFLLKVQDASDQVSTSKVSVIVHRPDITPLGAVVEELITIKLPQNHAILDGSKSSGVTKENIIEWTQLKGPNTSLLKNVTVISSDSKADSNNYLSRLKSNATGLTKGEYTFQLQLWSKDKTKSSKGVVKVVVRQEANKSPKADGGGDFSVVLPISLVLVNGTLSSDDVGIVRWLWERLPTSLAAGTVLGKSSTTSVLMLTGLVVGQYQWKLTVWDEKGAHSSDTVSFMVKAGINKMDEVAVLLGAGVESVSEAQIRSTLQNLKLMLPATVSLMMLGYTGLPSTGESAITIIGNEELQNYHNTLVAPVNNKSESSSSARKDDGSMKTKVVSGVYLADTLRNGILRANSASSSLFDVAITGLFYYFKPKML